MINVLYMNLKTAKFNGWTLLKRYLVKVLNVIEWYLIFIGSLKGKPILCNFEWNFLVSKDAKIQNKKIPKTLKKLLLLEEWIAKKW